MAALNQSQHLPRTGALYLLGRLPGSLLILSLLCVYIFAQTADPESGKTTKDLEANEKKAYSRIKGVVVEAQSLRLPVNKVRIQVMGACLLWPADQTQARAIIKQATGAVSAHFTGLSAEDRDLPQNRLTHNRLRQELVWLIAPLDSRLALEFLRATSREPTPPRVPGGPTPRDEEIWLEMSLAAQIAEQDSKLATQIAEESLNRGSYTGLVRIVAKMRQSDPRAASDLAARIASRLKSEDLSLNSEALNATLDLLTAARAGEGTKKILSGDRTGEMLLDQQGYRDVIAMIAQAAANLPLSRINTSHGLFYVLDLIMPEMEKLLPNQVAAIRQRKAIYEQSLSPAARARKNYEKLMNQGTVDALVEAAAKAPPEVKDELYSRAVRKSLGENDAERARQTVGNISNPQERAAKMREIEQHVFSANAQQVKLEDAGQYIPPGSSIEERISSLIHLANEATQKAEKAVARRYLEDALGLVAPRAQNPFHFSTQLQVAHAYSPLDLNRSFEIIEAAIDRLNELLDAAALLDGFGGDFFKDGELKPYEGGMWEELLRQCSEELAAIAPGDPERALAAVGNLRRPEAQALATIRVAQRVLSEQNDRRASHSKK